MNKFSIKVVGLIVVIMISMPIVNAQPASRAVENFTSASAPASTKSARVENRRLAKAVRRALAKVKNLDSTKIVVIAKSGEITLDGSVPTASQIDLAGSAAGDVSGVANVVNKLSVRAVGQ